MRELGGEAPTRVCPLIEAEGANHATLEDSAPSTAVSPAYSQYTVAAM